MVGVAVLPTEDGSGSAGSSDQLPSAGAVLKANENEFAFVACIAGVVLLLCCCMWWRYTPALKRSVVLETQARLLQ